MTVKIGINGFGRIARLPPMRLRPQGHQHRNGRRQRHHLRGNQIFVDDKTINVLPVRTPNVIPWGEPGVDIVLESTGRFRTRETAAGHLSAGAASSTPASRWPMTAW
jgi:glyceraldehyde-3-phosphate dehydrogenase/erythrose-4-phosphate dehydrogenase